MTKKNKPKSTSKRRWIIAAITTLALTLAINAGLLIFSAHADIYLGRGTAVITQAEGTETWPSTYYTQDYGTAGDLAAAAAKLVEQIEAEGMVLLKNNGTLPLATGAGSQARITLLGRSAADPVYGGSGSGSVDLSSVVDLKTALESRAFAVNPVAYGELADYAKFTTRLSTTGAAVRVYEHPKANIAMDRPSSSTYFIGEMPVADYSAAAKASFKDYGDAAVIVIGRAGGEGGDLTKDMKGSDDNYSPGQHQLELNKDEKDLIALAKANFDRVVVLVNASSAMELGILEEDPAIDSILWIGSPGQTGFYAVADALSGAVNPSGRTVDIYAADFTKDPTFVNFGDYKYRNVHGGNAIGNGYFVQYEEGLYYGYRYYETAAAEGFIDYDQAVVYPFGHGLSYTTFQWDLVEQTSTPTAITFKVRVSNTGSVAGKDVVQLYFSAPYTKGGIEKPAVVLGDFTKTRLLAPGEADTLTLSVDIEDMASYDYLTERAWVLEKGAYTLSIRDNSHTVHQGIAPVVHTVPATVVYAGGKHRESDNTEVTNRFDDVSAGVRSMNRADFAGTFPTAPKGSDLEASDEVIAGFQPWVAAEHQLKNAPRVTTGAANGLSLIDMRGRDFDDPAWEPFLDQIKPADIAGIVTNSAYVTDAITSLGKPATVELDGPAGISAFMGDIHGTAFPSAVVIASTYNTDLARDMGHMIGNEGLHYGVNGWYAPAVNIHRSPFAGRNFEYYSEDPYLSGKLATAVVSGAADKGVYAFLKHFALNDQETNRNNNGVATWADEQTIREIYLKPFEMVVKDARTTIRYIADAQGTMAEKEIPAATALMSAFNRIGAIWTGGSEPLLQTVLRDEWGFEGVVISDFNLYPHMFVNQGLAAGTDFNITFSSMKQMEDSTSPTAQFYLRRTAHRLLYTIANSSAMNGLVPGTTVSYTLAPWRVGLIVLDLAAAGLVLVFILRGIRGKKGKIA